jgi:hypothetical protein
MRHLFGFLVIALIPSARAADGPAKPSGGWEFNRHVIPILTRAGCNSGACHGALAGKGGFKLSLRGFDPAADHYAMTRQAAARRVDLGSPADSLLLKKPTRTLPHGGGTRFADDSPQYRVLKEWIVAGAPGPDPKAPTLVRITVDPPAKPAKPGDKFAVGVRAEYADGSADDVTMLARFASTEDQVATVDEDGNVTVAGPGVAAVTAVFGNRVAACTVTVPFPNAVEDSAFASAAKHNFVDDPVTRKLAQLRLPPAGPCTDAEYCRRAFLDTCGILPKAAELESFLADKDPKKREKLADALLARPEYVDYWTHKWGDLFLVGTRKLPQPAVWAFHAAIRRAVADNLSWDRFARDVVTAAGSTLAHGTANFFVLHKDPSELAETTALAFLGTSIGCARCHNHPLEKWTQDQYWAFANLFGRVGLKNGDVAGDVFVQSLPAGEALHPRRGVPMPPTPLGGVAVPPTADRRAAFADWLTAPDNPYFAKAIVNRVWKNFMGRGLVEAEDDIRDSNPPSNPELLDALAPDFVANKYDVKHLMRVILTSAAYQRSSVAPPGTAADDRFYSRYLVRRLPAEVILDAYADLTGVPTPFSELNIGVSGGTAKSDQYPPGTRAVQLPDAQLVSRFLDAFGRAERMQTCSCERTTDASVGQALHLNNGQTLNDKLRAKTGTVRKWVEDKITDEEIVTRLFAAALSRPPTEKERAAYVEVLKASNSADDRARVVEDLFWAVLTSREFMFNH